MTARTHFSPNINSLAIEKISIEPEFEPLRFTETEIDNVKSLIAHVSFRVVSATEHPSTFVVRTRIDRSDQPLIELIRDTYSMLISQCKSTQHL